MLPAQRTELILKRNLAVMLLLRRDVFADLPDVRLAHGERAVSPLPEKIRIGRALLLHPHGGAVFHRFHQLGDGDGAGKIAQDVNVILDAVDEDRFAADALQDSGHVGVEPCAEAGVFEERHAVLRAENNVDDDAGEGLRHGGDCCAPLGLCTFFVCDPRAALVPA